MNTEPQTRYSRGDRIGGRFLVHEMLQGGMGEVYLCLDLKVMAPIALKTFQQRFLTNKEVRQRFEQEAYTWVSLGRHPHIVRCFYLDDAIDICDSRPFLRLEWIAGEEGRSADLRSWLRRGPLSPKQALQLAIDICRGLEYAGRKVPGLVHRDLKPDNVLVVQQGIAKITDFGLAKLIQDAQMLTPSARSEGLGHMVGVGEEVLGSAPFHHKLTNVGGVVGTPSYMAPEQWRGEEVDARTDLYALGCILYEMLTGRPAFRAATLEGLRHAHLAGIPPSLPELEGGTDSTASIGKLVVWCLSREVDDRPGSASILLTTLEEVYEEAFGSRWRRLPEEEAFTMVDYTNQANTYHRLQCYEEALRDYGKAIELDPNDSRVYTNRGNTYQSLQRYEEALRDCDRAIELDPHDPKVYNNRGIINDALKRHEEALRDLDKAVKLDASFTQAYYNRGVSYKMLQRFKDALGDFGTAIALEPGFVLAYIARGNTLDSLQRYEEAIRDFDRAVELDPNSANAYFARGVACHRLGRYAEALNDFGESLEIKPNDADAYAYRGATLATIQRYVEALSDFNKVIDLLPYDSMAHYNRGGIYYRLQCYEEALRDYDRAIELEPGHRDSYRDRANTFLRLRRYEEARRDYDRAIELGPNTSPDVHYNRGNVLILLQCYEEALRDYDQAIKIDPGYANAYHNRANAYRILDRYEEALRDYNRTLELVPNHAQTHYNKGSLLERMNRLP